MNTVRLVRTKEMSHEDWLKWRKKGIGGSDVAAICRMSRYRSPIEVYLDKLGQIEPVEDNPKMVAGRRLESFIGDWFAEETGYKVRRQNCIFRHPKHAFMLANIDRWLPGMNAGLEIKNTGEFGREDWTGTQAPTEYVLQCNHYMAVTGAERWYIAVLIGGWDFQWRVIERDENLIRDVIEVEHEFWLNHVQAKVPPAFSHQDTSRLSKMYPTSQLVSIDLAEDAYPIIQQLLESRKANREAMVKEETAKNQLKGLMGEAESAYWQGNLIFTWKTNKKGTRPFNVIGGHE